MNEKDNLEVAELAAKLKELEITKDDYWRLRKDKARKEVQDELCSKVTSLCCYTEHIHNSVEGLSSCIASEGVFSDFKERMEETKEEVAFVLQELEEIECSYKRIVKQLEKMPADF